jgi:hypothetical protein
MKMEQDRKIIEDAIDKLLVYMNDRIEETGKPITIATFNFTPECEDVVKIIGSVELLERVLKICMTRKFITKRFLSGPEFGNLMLSEEGQGRAISCTNSNPAESTSGSTISIGSLVNNGSAQFGDNNTQNIENTFTYLIEQIDKSSASPEQKNEAKNLIKRILEHPVTSAIIGVASTIIAAKLGV